MRVIGGEFRSRRLKTLPGLGLRPTPDRLRETLFDVLAPRIAGAVFVDAYAGSGAVGIEALSRGAQSAVFLERNRGAIRVIQENLASLGLTGRALVVAGPAVKALREHAADVVFVDPPYGDAHEYRAALSALGEAPAALAIAQHDKHHPLADRYGLLRRVRALKQGDNMLSFFEPE